MRLRTFRLSSAAVALAVVLVLCSTGAAFAATGQPTLGLSALQAKLDASPTGSVTGYFKTVLKGSAIATVPVDVLAVTGESDPTAALILFEAKGPDIARFGGIVEGMSGSPIYVEDDGVDKVIGAVSYGDTFTLGGSGLATPIESMLKIAADYRPRVEPLSQPVLMSGRLVDEIVVPGTADPAPYAETGAFVAKPLSGVFVGGLRPTSALFADLRSRLASHGITVVSADAALSAGTSTFTTDLVPGAAVGTLASRGSLWLGGLGTVTYADGDTVLAFGHPAFFTGPTSLYLTNAWISGVWPSSYSPYKLGYPTAIRGTVTQDRAAGVMGVLGAMPAETPVYSRAVNVGTGQEATSVVYFASELFDANETAFFAGSAASIAASRLFDQANTPGSANTTTTVVVSDGTSEYTVVMANLIDSDSDIPTALSVDVDSALGELLSVLADGVQRPHIVSVTLDASVSTERRAARVVGVNLDEPLRAGDNLVHISLLAYGRAATQTVDATLTIPEESPLTGTLSASGIVGDEGDGADPGDGLGSARPRRTIASVVGDLNAALPYNAVIVTFEPGESLAGSGGAIAPAPADGEAIESTLATPWAVSGQAKTVVTEVSAFASTVDYGWSSMVEGEIFGPTVPVAVSVYGTTAGTGTEVLLGTDVARLDPDTGALRYEVFLPELYANTALRVRVAGGEGFTPADGYALQQVRARVTLRASSKVLWWRHPITLTASVVPGRSTGRVTFQYYDAKKHVWRTIARASLHRGLTTSRASVRWTPPRAKTKVRVVYSGGLYNAGSRSGTLTITRH